MADCSNHIWFFRWVSHTSTSANVALSYENICLADDPALHHYYSLPSISSQTHQQTCPRCWEEWGEMPLLSFVWQDQCWTEYLSLGGKVETMFREDESKIPWNLPRLLHFLPLPALAMCLSPTKTKGRTVLGDLLSPYVQMTLVSLPVIASVWSLLQMLPNPIRTTHLSALSPLGHGDKCPGCGTTERSLSRGGRGLEQIPALGWNKERDVFSLLKRQSVVQFCLTVPCSPC